MAKDKDKKKGSGRPWRENIEAIAVSVIVIVLFKYFVLEAYKIPTGSMQPTLMGWDDGKGGGIFDRVVVDKLSYRFRDPKRWEITVFRYPLDTSKNFIKRLVGMPGEHLKVENGDLWVRQSEEEAWTALRRPTRLQDVHFKTLEIQEAWKNQGSWTQDEDGLTVAGAGSARGARARSALEMQPALAHSVGATAVLKALASGDYFDGGSPGPSAPLEQDSVLCGRQ